MTQLEVPCLHRLTPKGLGILDPIHAGLGLAPDVDSIIERLSELDKAVQTQGRGIRSHFVTFDDGWVDVLMLRETFDNLLFLQPIIFLTDKQLLGERALLPLHRLYQHCNDHGLELRNMERQGLQRDKLKKLSEVEQHQLLDNAGVKRYWAHEHVLSSFDISEMSKNGWLVGSHGGNHHDMTTDDAEHLAVHLSNSYGIVKKAGYLPWFAWPEGRCSQRSYFIAKEAGFTKQFTLRGESTLKVSTDIVCRKIWR